MQSDWTSEDVDQGPAIGAIVPWFGSKRRLAATVVTELGAHRLYLEPFCGSLAILGTKPACSMELVNDLNGDLINLARVMQHRSLGPQLYRRLRRTIMSDQVFEESAGIIRDSPPCQPGPEGGAEPARA